MADPTEPPLLRPAGPGGDDTTRTRDTPRHVGTFHVTRTPRYEGADDLHGTADTAPDEFLLLVDGQEIGGTYWCSYNPAASAGWGSDDGGLPGASWASWGPRGLSCGHATREAAEQAQVREYVTDPSRYDRELEIARAGRKAETARRSGQASTSAARPSSAANVSTTNPASPSPSR